MERRVPHQEALGFIAAEIRASDVRKTVRTFRAHAPWTALEKWIYYDNTKSVVSALKDCGAFESFCDDLEENVDLSHPELKAQDAINYMHELKCVIFNSDFSKVVDPVTLGYVFM